MEFQSDLEIMEEALELARKAARKGEVPVGAIVFDRFTNKIIGRGYNKRERGKDATAHAEMIAIKQACKKRRGFRLDGCDLFVTMAPCVMCAGAAVNARITRVIYGAESDRIDDEFLKKIFVNDKFNHKVAFAGGVLAEESREIVQRFFKNARSDK